MNRPNERTGATPRASLRWGRAILEPGRAARRGVTLIELLVVVSIVMLLAAAAVPAMRMASEGRRTREAARALNVYLGAARNRAVEIGRPAGVVIRRMEGVPDAAVVVDQVESPPPYSGDVVGARIRLTPVQPGGDVWNVQFEPAGAGAMWLASNPDPGQPGVVKTGDLLQLNYQGRYYVMQFQGAMNIVRLVDASGMVETGGGQQSVVLPLEVLAQGVPFQVLRTPIRSGAPPLQLPAGAVIDLAFSGFQFGFPVLINQSQPNWQQTCALNQTFFSSANLANWPVYILFSPNGSVDRVYAGALNQPPVEPIYLLVGRRDRVPATLAADGVANWMDPAGSLWVTISPQSGMVSVAPVAVPASQELYARLYESREFAHKAIHLGGR